MGEQSGGSLVTDREERQWKIRDYLGNRNVTIRDEAMISAGNLFGPELRNANAWQPSSPAEIPPSYDCPLSINISIYYAHIDQNLRL